MDHGLTLPVIEQAIKCGFSSIMFDGSSLPYAENIAKTQEIVTLCHNYGISVEGEPKLDFDRLQQINQAVSEFPLPTSFTDVMINRQNGDRTFFII